MPSSASTACCRRWPAPTCRSREVICLCQDEAVIGRAFYLMAFVDGRVLWQQSLPGMDPAERGRIYDEMNRVISALHQVDYEAIGLGDFGKPGNYFARQIGRWSKQYLASETDPIPEMNRLIDWLPAHIPAGDETSIVHGDFRLDNMIFAADRAEGDRGAGLGVVDAGASARGFFLPLHGLSHPAGAVPRHRRPRPRGARHPVRGSVQGQLLPAHRPGPHRQLGLLPRVQLLPACGNPAGDHEAGRRRHGGEHRGGSGGSRARPLAELAWKFAQRIGAWHRISGQFHRHSAGRRRRGPRPPPLLGDGTRGASR